jgi:hypothetical protein
MQLQLQEMEVIFFHRWNFQTSNIFTAILSGSHEISISDANGCGSTIVIQLINSPKYFTNGDGFNDTWNVTAMPNQEILNYISTTDMANS